MSLRIGMVHWNYQKKVKTWGVGVAVHELANALVQGKFCTLLFSQPQAKGCYL